MKKITFALSFSLLLFCCKKEENFSGDALSVDELGEPVPCFGNSWKQIYPWPFGNGIGEVYFDNDFFGYNNKMYVPSVTEQRVYIFDGSTWTSIPSNVPNYDYAHQLFVVGANAYILQTPPSPNRLWQYQIANNTWTEKASFPGPFRFDFSIFVIDSKAYLTGGRYNNTQRKDLWAYNSVNDSWSQKASYPNDVPGRNHAAAFTIGNIGYVVGGTNQTTWLLERDHTRYKTLLAYNPVTNAWDVKAPYPGAVEDSPLAFVINNTAYVGLNDSSFYKYSATSNSWAPIAPLLNVNSYYSASAVIDSKAYIVAFSDGSVQGQYKYSPKVCGNIGPSQ
ncbi:MAG: hypothetical protein H7Y31_09130 [Chitinophagaceae bacterium]|nr:hypothetical protein [Chitinophagaceae bacterium]